MHEATQFGLWPEPEPWCVVLVVVVAFVVGGGLGGLGLGGLGLGGVGRGGDGPGPGLGFGVTGAMVVWPCDAEAGAGLKMFT